MLNIYVSKEIIKVNEVNLLSMDIEVLKKIPYSIAIKYRDYISALEICVEDCLTIPTHIKDEAGYLVALEKLETIIKEEKDMVENNEIVNEVVNEVVVENTNNEEELIMKTAKEKMNIAVADMMNKFAEAKESIKVGAGMTKDEYFDRVDNSLNVVKGAFGDILGKIDSLLGYSVLKDDILEIIEAGCSEKTSKKDLFRMSAKCREIIEKKIAKVELLGDPDKAATLKELIGSVKDESIFTMFFSTIIWVTKKVARKLRIWFNVDDEKSVMGSICKSVSGFVGILRAGAKIVWNTSKFVVSFLVAGAIKIADFVFRAITTLVSKIKAFAMEKYEKLTDKDVEEDLEDLEE